MNRSLSLFGALFASLLVFGCGGGGGGGSKSSGGGGTGTLAVAVDPSGGPVGSSVILSIYRSDGKKIDEKPADLSPGALPVQFSRLPAGTLRLHAELSSRARDSSVLSVDTTFQGGTIADPIGLALARAVDRVTVAPLANSVELHKSVSFFAAARGTDNSFVFTLPTDFTWSSDPEAVATVDSAGTATGVAQGSATITARHTASGKTGSATLGVFSSEITTGKWTIMVYMDAANDLYPYAAKNLNQMEAIANNPNVRFVVQWKQVQGLDGNDDPLFDGTHRYLAQYDTTSLSNINNPIVSSLVQDMGGNVDMADPNQLHNFVAWAKQKYPAEHYALVLWSHGGGWFSRRAQVRPTSRAIIFDDQTGNELSLPEISGALDDNGLDILSYDACLMQGAESLVEFAKKTKFIVGSEDDVPADGLPYNTVFAKFTSDPDTNSGDLAADIVAKYVSKYKNAGVLFPVQMSALDTSTEPTFETALDNFAQKLVSDPASAANMPGIRSSATRIEPSALYWYYDLSQIATLVNGQAAFNADTKAAATSLLSAINGVVKADQYGTTGSPASHLKGLSIEFGSRASFGDYATGYSHLRLSQNTSWDEFLASAANP